MCSLQDDKGFLWFGTKDGLNRFDGYTFKVFRNDTRDTGTIGNNVILCLHKDAKGNVWVGTERGVYLYNAVKESFSHLPCSGESDIHDIKTDGAGNLWFIGGFKLHRYNIGSSQSQTFGHAGFEATSLLFKNGTLWVSAATDGQLHRYNAGSNSFTAFSLFKHSQPATSQWIQKIYDGGQTTILAGTSNQGVKVFDIATGDYHDVINYNANKTEIFVRDFIRFDEQNIWIATESGIYTYNLQSKSIALMSKQYNNPYALSDNAVYTFCKDHEGGIWIGTYFGGLNYYARAYTYFEKFFPRVGENSLSGNAVREIYPDQFGNTWIGTEDGGLNRYSAQTGKFDNYQPLGLPFNVSASNIHGLLASGNQLLIGTFEHGLDVMDIPTKKVIRHFTVSNTPNLKSNFFYCIYKTPAGDIITGTTRGLYTYHPQQYNFTIIDAMPADLFYTSILQTHEHTLWAGTFRDGLYYLKPGTKTANVFKYNAKDTTSLSDNHINRLFEDSNQNLWIATENGLCKLNTNKKTFTRYTTANGLPSNIIYAMLEDAHQNLWITTSKGLVSMNIMSKSIKVYTKANGLLSDQFNYNSAYQDKAGNMYFGCLKGMIRFNPNQFISNSYIPPVYLTGFQINNKDLDIGKNQSPLNRSIIYTNKIVLSYTQSSFSIDFAALGYTSPQMTAYAYKMTGLDKEWVHLSSNRKVYFTKLTAGKYTFEVKAANGNGQWGKNITRLIIVIEPPFWASKVAYLLYTLVTLFFIYFIVKSYRTKVEKINRRKLELLENEKGKEIYNAKIAFFTHIAHEIRTPLTLIKGPMEKIMKQAVTLPAIQKNLKIMELNTNRLLNLTTQLLDFRKTEIKGFSLNFVKADIIKLINENVVVFEPFIKQKKLSINVHFTVKQFWAYVDIEALNKILSNLLSNAVKYADTIIDVTLQVNGSNFDIVIKNDGYLIPAEMKEKIFEPFFRIKEIEKISGTGIGLSLSRSLAQLHKGTLQLHVLHDTLNTFILTLPVHHEIEFNLN